MTTCTSNSPATRAERALHTLSAEPRPVVRWAGSKQRLLHLLLDVLPYSFDRYIEPFFGAGSLFFLLEPRRALLGDACSELIDTYKAIRDNPAAVLRYVGELDPQDSEQFYRIRASRSSGPYKRAAEFLFLNRAGWNGLYRVNAKGIYNVPYGQPRTSHIVEPSNLRACARALGRPQVSLRHTGYESLVRQAGEGDFLFLDPPYVTGHNNNGFVDYNERLFRWQDQETLATLAADAAGRGAYVVVTNAYHDAVLGLYPTFSVRELQRSSTLASDTTARRRVSEALLWRAPGGNTNAESG